MLPGVPFQHRGGFGSQRTVHAQIDAHGSAPIVLALDRFERALEQRRPVPLEHGHQDADRDARGFAHRRTL